MPVDIRCYILDETYGRDESRDWENESAAFKRRLEIEYGLPFKYEDIGTGASAPAFFSTLMELSAYAGGVFIVGFFAGKKIKENLDAWAEIFSRLKKFLNRNPIFNREGAAALAIAALHDSLGKWPVSIQLVGYRADSVMNLPFEELVEDETALTAVEQPSIVVDSIVHIFQINADGRQFKAFVYRSDVRLLELPGS